MPNAEELHATIEAQLAQGGLDLATIERDLGHTIVPHHLGGTTDVEAPYAILRELREGRGAPDMRKSLELHQTLGEGGMGIVWLGTQRALDRQVAVKSLRPENRSDRQTLKLLREAWVTGALEHPNIVPVYDIDLDDEGEALIVLKRIDGIEWLELLHDEEEIARRVGTKDPLEWKLSIFLQVTNAISFAHSRGIVHRDIKPENVMIGEFGEVYVLDWGIAVALEDDHGGRFPLAKNAGELAGTPCYMAPEMLGGRPELLGPHTDVYLLGAMLYEIATGEVPHQGETLMQIVHSVSLSEPTFDGEVHQELQEIIKKAMRAEPTERYASVGELRQAIRDYLGHHSSRELTREAKERLTELKTILAEQRATGTEESEGEEGPGEEEASEAIYHLFGECRFGFQQALTTWPENPEAIQGRAEAVEAMVRHELQAGDPRLASHLLGELHDPPAELAAEVARLKKEQEEKQESLEALGRDHDPETGRRTRVFGSTVFGIVFVFGSIAPELIDPASFPFSLQAMTLLICGLLIVMLGAFTFWARESLMKTAFNRRVGLSIFLTLATQLMIGLIDWSKGTPHVETMQHFVLTWTIISAMIGISVDRRLFASTAGFVAAYAVISLFPRWTYYAMAVSNLVLFVNVLAAWGDPKDRRALLERGIEQAKRRARRREARRRLWAMRFQQNRQRPDPDQN